MPTLEYQRPRPAVTSGLRIRKLLLFVWLPAAVIGTLIGVLGCMSYNRMAGTQLTKTQIAGTALSMNAGPFVGPLHGRNAFNPFYRMLIPAGVGVLALVWIPTLVMRRPRRAGRAALIVFHAAGAAIWYLTAMLSLLYHLN